MTSPFELLERIGRGGMGVVWKARDNGTGEIVALKLLHEMYAEDEAYLERFPREVDIARRIDSPYVVKVLGYGSLDGRPFMAMEYVGGPSLKELLAERGKLSWDEARPVVHDIAQGLAAAHKAGVIHRDMKPSNILLTNEGFAKVADFGIAKALDMTALTGTSTMLGTPHYMAPDLETTPASDLYALGCVLYQMLSGRPPFDGDSQQRIVVAHIRQKPNLETLEGPAQRILGRLLAKTSKGRPPIDWVLAETCSAQPSRSSLSTSIHLTVYAPPHSSNLPLALVLLLAVILTIAAVLGVFMFDGVG